MPELRRDSFALPIDRGLKLRTTNFWDPSASRGLMAAHEPFHLQALSVVVVEATPRARVLSVTPAMVYTLSVSVRGTGGPGLPVGAVVGIPL